MTRTPPKIFVSHANKDSDLVDALVKYLLNALAIQDPRVILCTSLPEHELPVGAPIPAAILKALRDARVVIGLLTPNSLERQAVMMELGAAWALEKMFIPILYGVGFDRIPDWLSSHAISLDRSVNQFNSFNARMVNALDAVVEHTSLAKRPDTVVSRSVHDFFEHIRNLTPTEMTQTTTNLKSRIRSKVITWANGLRQGAMSFARPDDVRQYMALVAESRPHLPPSASVQEFKDMPNGMFGSMGFTSVATSTLATAAELLASELE